MSVGETKLEKLDLIERRGRVNGEPARMFVRVVNHQGGPRQNTRGTPGKTPGYTEYIIEKIDTERGKGPSEEIEMGK